MDWILAIVKKHLQNGVFNEEEFVKDINKEFPKHAVPKEQYNTIAEAKKKLEQDLAERDKQLEDLKKVDAESLKAEIARLQEENKKAREAYEKELKDIQLTSAIKLALAGRVYDEDIVANLIKEDQLVLGEDGKVVGLDDQINALRETKSFLFLPEQNNQQQLGFQKVGNEPQNSQQALDDAISRAFGNLKE